MNTNRKTAFGIFGATAAAALIACGTAPAIADDTTESTNNAHTKVRILDHVGLSNESPIVVSPEVGTGDISPEVSTGDVTTGDVETGDVHTGDVNAGNGNVDAGNGNDVDAGNGNDVGSDNDVDGDDSDSGNRTSIGVSVEASIED